MHYGYIINVSFPSLTLVSQTNAADTIIPHGRFSVYSDECMPGYSGNQTKLTGGHIELEKRSKMRFRPNDINIICYFEA